MKKIIACLAIAGFANAAFAEGSDVEFFYQPDAGAMDLEASYGMESISIDASTGGGTYDISSSLINLSFHYGINEMMAVGVSVGQLDQTEDDGSPPDGETGGMTDPTVHFLARMPMGGGNLRYGANLNLAMGDVEEDSDGKVNASDGRMELQGYIGYDHHMGTSAVGGRLAFDLLAGEFTYVDKTTTPETEAKLEGGKEMNLSLFWECMDNPDYMWGAEFFRNAATEVTAVANGSMVAPEQTIMGIGYYSRWKVSEMVDITPRLRYMFDVDVDVDTLDGGSGHEITLGARVHF